MVKRVSNDFLWWFTPSNDALLNDNDEFTLSWTVSKRKASGLCVSQSLKLDDAKSRHHAGRDDLS
jgi:hypothetical protein